MTEQTVVGGGFDRGVELIDGEPRTVIDYLMSELQGLANWADEVGPEQVRAAYRRANEHVLSWRPHAPESLDRDSGRKTSQAMPGESNIQGGKRELSDTAPFDFGDTP